jgi:arylsulfatase A-like enzyme
MKQKSLLLITVDCLRADHAGFHGYGRGTTPFLDSLASTSFVVPSAIVAGAPTYYSFPAIMASRYPLGLGRDVLGIAPGEPTLATSLQAAGYSTAAFVAGNPYLSPRTGFHQGFTRFRDFLSTPLPGSTGPSEPGRFNGFNRKLQKASRKTESTAVAYEEFYFRYCQWKLSRRAPSFDQLRRYPAADVIVDQARSWLSGTREQPFFLWLHLMDAHHPYFPPEQALSELRCGDIGANRAAFVNAFWSRDRVTRRKLLRYQKEIVSLYDAGIYWADKQIGRLITALKHLRKWDDTVLAVTADHGEELLDSDARYHSPTGLSERLIHVPLLIRVPDQEGVQQSDLPFSLIHLAPTLLDILKVGKPPSFQGKSFWADMKLGHSDASAAIVECVHACQNAFPRENRLGPRLLAVRDTRHKLVINFHDQTERMFDLANDALESRPLDESRCRVEHERLLKVAHQHLSSETRDPQLQLRARIRDIQQLAMRITEPKTELASASTS